MKNIVRFWALVSAGLIGVACVGDEPAATPAPETPSETENAPPTAAAGAGRTVLVGTRVELDASGSSDPDGDALTFAWAITSKPDGSAAALHDTKSRTPRFVVDVAGDYTIELTASDGVASAKDTVTVRGNTAPVAHAGDDQTSKLGEEVILSGAGSSDPDGDPLTYAWAFISRPEASEAALTNAASATPSFSPDLVGLYTVELTVSDGHAEARARVTVNVTPEGGGGSGALYVSPTGDDTKPGTLAEPLRTIGEALTRIEASGGAVKRVVLASGTYEEPFNHAIARTVEVVGPAAGAPAALLKAGGTLFAVEGATASLSLLRVSVESGGSALTVFDEGTLNLTDVACEAKTCVLGADEDDEQRSSGAVQIVQSKLTGAAPPGSGVALSNGSLSVKDCTIEAFKTGVSLFRASVLLRGTTVRKSSDYGLGSISVSAGDLRVEDSTFEQNATGVYLYGSPDAVVKNTTIKTSSDRGVSLHGGSGARLDDVTIENGGVGVYVDTTGASTVRLRRTKIQFHGSHALHVKGKASKVDLGTAGEAGANVLRNLYVIGFPINGWSLFDDRPAGATGAITMSQTKLDGGANVFPAGTYQGPYTHTPDGTLKIVAAGNVVVAH